jgi:hypothetical protein
MFFGELQLERRDGAQAGHGGHPLLLANEERALDRCASVSLHGLEHWFERAGWWDHAVLVCVLASVDDVNGRVAML